jgi:hypothetical protein
MLGLAVGAALDVLLRVHMFMCVHMLMCVRVCVSAYVCALPRSCMWLTKIVRKEYHRGYVLIVLRGLIQLVPTSKSV